MSESDDGRALNPGERLVTRDGRLRRWDGFIAEDDGATAAEQLVRANRLAALDAMLPKAEADVSAKEAALAEINEAIAAAQSTLREAQAAPNPPTPNCVKPCAMQTGPRTR